MRDLIHKIKILIYVCLQCTWGCIQTTLGFLFFLLNIHQRHYFYHGAIVTERQTTSSISLGLFVFIGTMPMRDHRRHPVPSKELANRLLVHEYGHTIQSILFGPFYLLVMGLPSLLWAKLPYYQEKRNQGVAYGSFYTERLANRLGEFVTKEKSLRDAVI